MGNRIRDMRLGDAPIEPTKTYRVAGWAPVAEGAKGEPVWEVVETYLKDKKVIAPPKVNVPKLVGMEGDPGMVV
jgi:sulfur-oxidizing protein SoxB